MVMTVMRVATPIVSPSIVSEARSLCARSALKHCARLSRTASMGRRKPFQLLYRIPRSARYELSEDAESSLKRIRRNGCAGYGVGFFVQHLPGKWVVRLR